MDCSRHIKNNEARRLATGVVQVSEKSTLWPWVNRAYSGNVLFACCSRSPGAANSILISKSESLDLTFDLLPLVSQPFESNAVTALKMRPQLVVAQEPSIDVFHCPAEMLTSREHYSKNLIEGRIMEGASHFLYIPRDFLGNRLPSNCAFPRKSRCSRANGGGHSKTEMLPIMDLLPSSQQP